MVNNTVILGVTKSTRVIFDVEFPQLTKVEIEPYNITYSRFIPVMVKLMLDAPRILNVIKKEHRQLQHIIKDHNVDVVISDNRFGLYHPTVETVYMTHQLNIKAGILSLWVNKIHEHYMKKFSKIWVPDFENARESLSGNLSRNTTLKNVNYIGPLSRLDPKTIKTESIDYLLLISGVEPQRTLFEELVCKQFEHSTQKTVLIRGTSKPPETVLPQNMRVIDLPDAFELAHCIKNADSVICRSGYSTLMDLHVLSKHKIILIPTPGQSEQQYLAEYWKKIYGAEVISQRNFHTWKLG